MADDNQLNSDNNLQTEGNLAEANDTQALDTSSLASESFEEDAEFFDDVDTWGNMIIASK